ncbi:MAG: ATP-binding protein [Muribaculaceae bacterium]|nr:ATP-binding protein [Muribaculaceae bacterium]
MVTDNPWWSSDSVPEFYTKMPHRAYLQDFYNEVSDLEMRRAVILMGPRRVGKTVMIFHSIEQLLKSGVDSKKIIYISIDTPIYNNVSLENLFLYARTALKNPDDKDGFYVFFDEIQYLKNWEVHLKSLVDSFRGNKFVGSGSAAAALKMKSIESGAGRFTDFMLPPLTFSEFLNFNGRQSLIVPSKNGITPIDTIDIDALNRLYIDYINYGGYPEVVFSEKIRQNPGQYIKNDIIDKVLLRDLPSLYGISDIQELNQLFVHIAFRSGNEFSYEGLSSESGIRKDVIRKYLEYLQAAFLIKVVNKIDQNAKRLKKVMSFKIYLTNPSLRCALFSPVGDDDDMLGSMVETAIFSQLIQRGESNFYYSNWTKGREKGEVDIVWVNQATQKASSIAEIKWTDRFAKNPTELKSLLSFVNANKGLRKIIVTSKTEISSYNLDAGETIIFIPAALYSLCVMGSTLKSNNAQL